MAPYLFNHARKKEIVIEKRVKKSAFFPRFQVDTREKEEHGRQAFPVNELREREGGRERERAGEGGGREAVRERGREGGRERGREREGGRPEAKRGRPLGMREGGRRPLGRLACGAVVTHEG